MPRTGEPKTRERKAPDAHGALRKEHRALSARHVLVAEAAMSEPQRRKSFNLAEKLRHFGNHLTAAMQARLDGLEGEPRYAGLRDGYAKAKRDGDEKRRLKARSALVKLQKAHGVTWDACRGENERSYASFGVPSIFALSIAENVWAGVKKVIYGDGKALGFRKRLDLPAIEAKQDCRGIVAGVGANGGLRLKAKWLGKDSCFGVAMPKGDAFLADELACVTAFLANAEGNEAAALARFAETGEYQETFRPCYASLVCKEIRGRLCVFVHLTVEGHALPKRKANGSLRHDFTKTGPVGADIGTQSAAAVSANAVLLENLAERDGHSTFASEAKERRILRYMDRSRRATNPQNYNPDGTVKKGRKKWVYSEGYKKARAFLRNLRRKNAESRKYANRELANRVRSMGDAFVTEPQNADALKRKAKPGRKKADGRPARRKRFGRSVQNRCPGGFLAELKKKFPRVLIVDGQKYRASQYDHVGDAYAKKKLSQRWHTTATGDRIQRDIYSAFLLACAADAERPDRGMCETLFPAFKVHHDLLVADIEMNGRTVKNSGIAPRKGIHEAA